MGEGQKPREEGRMGEGFFCGEKKAVQNSLENQNYFCPT